jgi:hypothetical protein
MIVVSQPAAFCMRLLHPRPGLCLSVPFAVALSDFPTPRAPAPASLPAGQLAAQHVGIDAYVPKHGLGTHCDPPTDASITGPEMLDSTSHLLEKKQFRKACKIARQSRKPRTGPDETCRLDTCSDRLELLGIGGVLGCRGHVGVFLGSQLPT